MNIFFEIENRTAIEHIHFDELRLKHNVIQEQGMNTMLNKNSE